MEEELLIRFMTHQCSAEEVEQIARWIAADKVNAAQFFEMERIWNLKDEAKYSNKKELNIEFNNLTSNIKRNESLQKAKRFSLVHWLGYVAAVVLLGLLSMHFYMDREEEVIAMNIIEVPNGQRVNLTLSDGTKVALNSGSKFSYPSNFSTENRTVGLTGEGFFEVTHKGGTPFIVNMPLLEVKVLGTKFNVKAYSDENTEVTLEQGKVEVLVDGDAEEKTPSGLQLYPNQQLVCTPNKEVSLKEVDAADSKNWLVGGFFFDNQPLSCIMKDLERRFGVKIQIKDKYLSDEIFTCHTKAGATLEQILDALKNTKELMYIQNDSTYILLTSKSKLPMK